MTEERGGVGSDEGFGMTDTDDERRARTSDDDFGGIKFRDDSNAVGAMDKFEGLDDGVGERVLAVGVELVDEGGKDFGIGVGGESVRFF